MQVGYPSDVTDEGWAFVVPYLDGRPGRPLARQVQDITGKHVELAYMDLGYTGQAGSQARHPDRGGQTQSQARIRAAAKTMGRRT